MRYQSQPVCLKRLALAQSIQLSAAATLPSAHQPCDGHFQAVIWVVFQLLHHHLILGNGLASS